MQVPQRRLATGLKIANPLDNPATFFTASSLASRAFEINRLFENTAKATNAIQTAQVGLSGIYTLVQQGQALAQQALSAKTTNTGTTLTAGSESAVNTFTTGAQGGAENANGKPKITRLSDGTSVAVWTSNGQDGGGTGVYAQRYDAQGAKLGNEFLINSTTTSNQQDAAVAALSNGDFVVTWSSNGNTAQDNAGYGVFAQRFSSSGVAQGGEFRVNTTTANDQTGSNITALTGGGFVVTWESNLQDGAGLGVYAQRYNASGVAQGGEFQINSTTAGSQESPSLAALNDGGFVAVWQSAGQDGDGAGIYAQRYNSSGAVVNSEVRVNTTTTSDQTAPGVAVLSGGGFVVTWQSNGQDGAGNGIYAQRYDSSGVAQGTEFRVNSTTTSDQTAPSIVATTDGGFAIAWESNGNTAQDNASRGIFAQRYTATGAAIESEFILNSNTAGDQYGVTLTALDGGGIGAVWTSPDANGDGVAMRRWTNTSPDTATRSQLAGIFNEIRTQIDAIANDSGYSGTNFLLNQNLTVNFDINSSSKMQIAGQMLNATGIGMTASLTSGSWSTDAEITSSLNAMTAAISTIEQASNRFDNNSVILSIREQFMDDIVTTLASGADDLTLADPEQEQASLLALQTRRELALLALSIATQADQSAISLLSGSRGFFS
jgi:flagellin-like hook-associated protein FlgL